MQPNTFVELHILQNFAPANLNRDDTNTPKTCDFGGHRRARISSQCIKRSIRTHPLFEQILEGNVGIRTKLLVRELKNNLLEKDFAESDLDAILPLFVGGAISGMDGDKTKVLFYLGRDEIGRLAGLVADNWGRLQEFIAGQADTADAKAKKKAAAEAKAFFSEITKDYQPGTKVADVAMFGRMLAEHPNYNAEAACQVAHAISTNRVNVEMDFFTAVDDLQPDEETGAGMMGTIEFNSSCFYRYAVIHLNQLLANMDQDSDLAKTSIEAFIRAAVAAIPTGKQNGFAAQNPPSFVMATVRRTGSPWSLANAFITPVYVGRQGNLVEKSIEVLARHWDELAKMYGADGLAAAPVCVLGEAQLHGLADGRVDSIDQLIAKVMETLQ
ncbi:MAG: type I-E CRISPR-associated protein Cas7/Cse4/CasC [Candidatus Lernaella stagnicola]|nr:type I-E CRISPR-associated protein Cas7/Cse4/CasC [Candidatus Lernaella stagnicola]